MGVGRRGSELAAGQGSGKNVRSGARGPVLPSLFCVASGESLHVSAPLCSSAHCRRAMGRTTNGACTMFFSRVAGAL